MFKHSLSLFSTTICLFVCVCCSNARLNERGYYIPKNPDFELKDKPGLNFGELDVSHLYELTKLIHEGELVYPLRLPQRDESEMSREAHSTRSFIAFHGNGELMSFKVPVEFSLTQVAVDSILTNGYTRVGYFYSTDGENFEREEFTYGDGSGHYIKFPFQLEEDGTVVMYMKGTIMYYTTTELNQ
ncbi:MAG: hypothetical protein HWE14_03340 [Flavobacteriia bacterium]|nr:hypothetical protein [Flavobacteriia bacterium]